MTGKKAQLAIALLLLCSCCASQELGAIASPLTAKLVPGQTLRYEVETVISYSADVLKGYSTTVPLGPCQFSISTVATLNRGSVAQDGNLPVKAEFQDPKISAWHCAGYDQKRMEKALREFAASPIVYQVGPHGEVGFEHSKRDRLAYESASDLLNKVALDLLQTRLADRPVSLGASWKPHGQFTYWKDFLLGGLEVSAATVRWKNTPKIAGHDCASITSKYVFAPTESTSGPVTAGGNLRQTPTNVLAGVQEVSLLFDLQERRIGWLHRAFRVENHVSVQPEEQIDPEVLTIRWEEEATARLIPEKDSIAWLAALKNFESTPEGGRKAVAAADASNASVADLARLAVPKRKSVSAIETLDLTPAGFARWEREFCDGSWPCAQISIALPGQVKVAEDAPLQTSYLARTDGTLVTVTVGPVLERKYQGLTADEELKKQAEFFLANQLWMTNKPGIGLEAQSTFVDGYPARLITFRGQRRDLASIQGTLAVLLSPWGETFPVTCSVDQRDAAKMQDLCERIVGLFRMRRPEDGGAQDDDP